jgi:L-iditol 2-dehydrogenase
MPDQTCAVWYGGSELRVEQRPVPPLGPTEALVEIALCGICGTDVHILDGEFPMYAPPRVLGHEFSGTVREVGSLVTAVKSGDRVVADPSVGCGACFFCRERLPYMCPNRQSFHGGFSEYTVAPQSALYPIPESVSLRAAALTEPLSCGLHAVMSAGVQPGDTVGIVGAGIIGLLLLQLVRRVGAARVLVSDLSPHRREIALRLGASEAVDPAVEDVVATAREITAGRGVDVAFEAVGSVPTVRDCLALPRRGGTAMVVGVAPPSAEVSIRPYDLFERELTIKGSFIRTYEFRRTVELLPSLELESLITDEFPLVDVADAIAHVRRREGIKTALRPH